MSDLIKKLTWDEFEYGDVVRLTRAVRKSSGKRFKFVGAVFDTGDTEQPLYFDLIEIGKGAMRSIVPENVVKDIEASRDAQARIKAQKV